MWQAEDSVWSTISESWGRGTQLRMAEAMSIKLTNLIEWSDKCYGRNMIWQQSF